MSLARVVKPRLAVVATLASLVLTGCSSNGGGDYQSTRYSQKHDSAPTAAPSVDHVQDAVPVPEVRTAAGNKSPYVVLGKKYRVLDTEIGYQARGMASWYGSKFHGHATSNGEIYDMYAMTAAHKTLPIPSYVRVKNLSNGKQVIVRVNDRGPFHGNRLIDLSYTAAKKLDYLKQGTAQVEITAIDPIAWQRQNAARLVAAQANQADASGSALPANTFLQVGAFSNAQTAQSLRNQLSQWLDHPVQINPPSAKTSLYRVRIGPVTNSHQVSRIRTLLAQKNLAAPHLVYE